MRPNGYVDLEEDPRIVQRRLWQPDWSNSVTIPRPYGTYHVPGKPQTPVATVHKPKILVQRSKKGKQRDDDSTDAAKDRALFSRLADKHSTISNSPRFGEEATMAQLDWSVLRAY
nr:unnamed protein product [Digitaria exilis]